MFKRENEWLVVISLSLFTLFMRKFVFTFLAAFVLADFSSYFIVMKSRPMVKFHYKQRRKKIFPKVIAREH